MSAVVSAVVGHHWDEQTPKTATHRQPLLPRPGGFALRTSAAWSHRLDVGAALARLRLQEGLQPGGRVEIRVLGNVEIHKGHNVVTLTGSAQRCMLGLLALDVGRPVTVTTLIDRTWRDEGREEPDPTTLTRYFTRIRDAIERAGGDRAWLRHDPGVHAYILDVDPDTVDYHRFLRETRAAGEHHDPDRLHDALGLWRGTPLENVHQRWVDTFRHHAHAHRRTALATLWQLLLEQGRHHEIPPQLGPLEADIVHDERLLLLGAEALARTGQHVAIAAWADRIATGMRDLSGGTGLSATTQNHLHHLVTYPPGPTTPTPHNTTPTGPDHESDDLGAPRSAPGAGNRDRVGDRSTTIYGGVNGATGGITIGAATGDHLTVNQPAAPPPPESESPR
ncbi:BTAD domain-containing putative transcriptional regulator [Saccharothrix sp. BKS2]|uniref:BTAD domain-containing putative transcriptional regulator n=1 Tax=Saccharothrix sp. BKS2 TaxID=3064400 RepID=UPI0039EA974C